jgi:hypothetical protein
MAKTSTRDLSRTGHTDELSGGRQPCGDRTILSVLDTLRARGGARCMAGGHLRQPHCAICIPKGLRANCQER